MAHKAKVRDGKEFPYNACSRYFNNLQFEPGFLLRTLAHLSRFYVRPTLCLFS